MQMLKSHVILLYKLQGIDNEIFLIESRNIEREIKKIQKELEDFENDIKSFSNEIKEKEIEAKNIGVEIEELNKKEEKLRDSLSGGKISEKQIHATQIEIKTIARKRERLEETLVKTIDWIEDAKEKLSQLKKEFEEKKKESERDEKEILEEAQKGKDKLQELKEKREELLKRMPKSALSFYLKNFLRFRRKPVSIVYDRKCTECGVVLPTRILSILKNTQFSVTCENCNRLLIGKEDLESDS